MIPYEKRLSASIARVCDVTGATRGTGFFVDDAGLLLTCHHVAAAAISQGGPASVESAAGRWTFSADAISAFPTMDLATIQCSGSATTVPLPIASAVPSFSHFWSKGFQFEGVSIRAAFPCEGRITGRTSIRYQYFVGRNAHAVQCHLEDVYVLGSSDIDRGLSGAPLIDASAGVVVGVVVAKPDMKGSHASGFAVSLGSAEAPTVEGLAPLLHANRRTVAAGGPYLNGRGLQDLARQQRELTLQRLISERLYLRDQYQPRADENQIIADFMSSPKLVRPLIGRSGTGKTSMLAHLVESRQADCVIMLGRLLAFDRPGAGLIEALSRTLSASGARGPTVRPPDGPEALRGAVDELGAPLLVVLDGLNEILERFHAEIPTFLRTAVSELRECRGLLRLVISSRPEFWEIHSPALPNDVLWPGKSAQDPQRESSLGDFSEEEAALALRKYQLPTRWKTEATVRHPFLLRILWELARDEGSDNDQPIPRYAAMSEFVKRKCAHVALRLGGAFTRNTVENVLLKIAGTMHGRENALARDAINGLFGGSLSNTDALIHEGLLAEAAQGQLQFAFDELGDFLKAQTIDWSKPDALSHWFAKNEASPPTGVLYYALLGLHAAQQAEALQRALSVIVSSVERSTIEWSVCARTLERLSSDWSGAPPPGFSEANERLLALTPDDVLLQCDAANLLAALPMSATKRIDVAMRLAVSCEHYYSWEPKHWQRFLSFNGGIRPALRAAVQQNPVEAMSALARHLSDQRDLMGGSERGPAAVGDVAAGTLYHFRRASLDTLLELLPSTIDTYVHQRTLMTEVALVEPEAFTCALERWSVSPDARLRTLALEMAGQLLHEKAYSPCAGRLRLVVLRFESDPSDERKRLAKRILVWLPEERERLFDSVLADFRAAEEGSIDAWSLMSYADTHLAALLEAFDEYCRGADSVGQRRSSVVAALRVLAGKPELVLRAAAWLQQAYPYLEEERSEISRTIEHWMCELQPKDPSVTIIEPLALRIIADGPSHVRSGLVYAATYKGKDEFASLRRRLVTALLQLPDDPESIERMVELFAQDGTMPPFSDMIRLRLGPELYERTLLRSAVSHETFANVLAELITAGGGPPLEFDLRKYREQLALGGSPPDAAWTALSRRNPPLHE